MVVHFAGAPSFPIFDRFLSRCFSLSFFRNWRQDSILRPSERMHERMSRALPQDHGALVLTAESDVYCNVVMNLGKVKAHHVSYFTVECH